MKRQSPEAVIGPEQSTPGKAEPPPLFVRLDTIPAVERDVCKASEAFDDRVAATTDALSAATKGVESPRKSEGAARQFHEISIAFRAWSGAAAREIRSTIKVTGRHIAILVQAAAALLHLKHSDRRIEQARLELGEQCLRTQIGDPALRASIAAIDAQIATTMQKSTIRRLVDERRLLVLRLTDSSTEVATMSPAGGSLQAALDNRDRRVARYVELRRGLATFTRGSAVRITVGYAALAGILLWLFSRETASPPSPLLIVSSDTRPDQKTITMTDALQRYGVTANPLGPINGPTLRASSTSGDNALKFAADRQKELAEDRARAEQFEKKMAEAAQQRAAEEAASIAQAQEQRRREAERQTKLQESIRHANEVRAAEMERQAAAAASIAKAKAEADAERHAQERAEAERLAAEKAAELRRIEAEKAAAAKADAERQTAEHLRKLADDRRVQITASFRNWEETAKQLVPTPEELWQLYSAMQGSVLGRGRAPAGLSLLEARKRFWSRYPSSSELSRATADLKEVLAYKDIYWFLLRAADMPDSMGFRTSDLIVGLQKLDRRPTAEPISRPATAAYDRWLGAVQESLLRDRLPKGTSLEEAGQAALQKNHELYVEYVRIRNQDEFVQGWFRDVRTTEPLGYVAGHLMAIFELNTPHALTPRQALEEAEAILGTFGEQDFLKTVEETQRVAVDENNPAQFPQPVATNAAYYFEDRTPWVYRYFIDRLADASLRSSIVILFGDKNPYEARFWTGLRDNYRRARTLRSDEEIIQIGKSIRGLPWSRNRILDGESKRADLKSPGASFREMVVNPTKQLVVRPVSVLRIGDGDKLAEYVGKMIHFEGRVMEARVVPTSDKTQIHLVTLKFEGLDEKDLHVEAQGGTAINDGRWGPVGSNLVGKQIRVTAELSRNGNGELILPIEYPTDLQVLD